MKRLLIISLSSILYIGMVQAQLPKLSDEEIQQGWKLVFDGKTSTGWKSYRADLPFPEKGWIIENGVLIIDPAGRGGDIVTEEAFSDFELSVDFKITKGANSGIKYFILPGTNLGCEYQILDDENNPDAKLGKNGSRLQGGLYDVIPPAKDKKDNPVGEWNNARIISKGAQVEHWLNGKKIVEFERGSAAFKELKAESKFSAEENWATPVKSPILLQDHGDVVYFRNIKIRTF